MFETSEHKDKGTWRGENINTESADLKYHLFYSMDGSRTITNNETGEKKYFTFEGKEIILAKGKEKHSDASKGEASKPVEDSSNTNFSVLKSVAATGIAQELKYPILKTFPRGNNASHFAKFSLSFRNFDRTYTARSTSHAFLNREIPVNASPSTRWTGVRLDYGPNVATGNSTNWHWNVNK